MRGAGVESAVGDSWPAAPAKYLLSVPRLARRGRWEGALEGRASLLSRCWRLKGE